MADVNALKVEVRNEFGKGAARRTRREGKVPAVLYGHGTAPQHLALPAHDFAAILRNNGSNAILTLDIDGQSQLALTKEVTVHPIRPVILHADLLVVKKGEKVSVEVPVVVTGEAAPGTLVTQDANTIAVLAPALSIPEQFEISVEGAEVGTQFLAGQIALTDGVELEVDAETLLVNVIEAPVAELPEEAEGEAAEGDEAEAAEESGESTEESAE
jgi:large subunit ribosomal protein L25